MQREGDLHKLAFARIPEKLSSPASRLAAVLRLYTGGRPDEIHALEAETKHGLGRLQGETLPLEAAVDADVEVTRSVAGR